MVRYGAIALLFISVFLMIRGISETWKDRSIPSSEVSGKQPEPIEEAGGDIVFNPVVSPTLPDFKDGYLFNEKRALEEEKGPEPEPEEENLAGNDLGIDTDINETTFSGAIIADTFKKAIITYTPAPEQATPDKKTTRTSRRRTAPKKSRAAALETTQLMEGDLISGYKVSSIEQDKIVFTKEGETIEKYLYDPDKQRAAPVARAQPAPAVPPRPRSVSAATPPTATPLPAPVAPTGHASTEVERGAVERTITARRPSTARRLVVSRKPPPKPDTSRVSRRSRARAGVPTTPPPVMPGAPPFMNR